MRSKREPDDWAKRHQTFKAEMRVLMKELKKGTERLLRVAEAREKALKTHESRSKRKRRQS